MSDSTKNAQAKSTVFAGDDTLYEVLNLNQDYKYILYLVDGTGVGEKPREVAYLKPGEDFVCTDWDFVREQARKCHANEGGCFICAVIWAVRNPGVKP